MKSEALAIVWEACQVGPWVSRIEPSTPQTPVRLSSLPMPQLGYANGYPDHDLNWGNK